MMGMLDPRLIVLAMQIYESNARPFDPLHPPWALCPPHVKKGFLHMAAKEWRTCTDIAREDQDLSIYIQ